ncbi:hypothetical protein GCM10023191_005660 [Actinoallomurus oryzae]|uniref:Uncharacterized protein n=1 Tax=Actinoallomurus oryzae TaxID=502180 RepID=A0ABP8P8N5_9ACTN
MVASTQPGALQISQDLGDLRRALERLNADTESRAESARAAIARLFHFSDDLADWLMDGRHRIALPQHTVWERKGRHATDLLTPVLGQLAYPGATHGCATPQREALRVT